MDKKNNMKQAVYEMFGVGSAPEADPAASAPAEKEIVTEPQKAPETASAPQSKAHSSFFGPGTVLEGTLRSIGDVEIAGEFKGNITTEGTVILRSNIQGNITADSLQLSGCKLVGDVSVKNKVSVSKDSSICGNVTAREVQCAGQITGDLKISENATLEDTARVDGNIIAGTIAVVKGAQIHGGIEMKDTIRNKEKALKK